MFLNLKAITIIIILTIILNKNNKMALNGKNNIIIDNAPKNADIINLIKLVCLFKVISTVIKSNKS